MSGRDIQELWARIEAPTLLLHGTESRAGDPAADGRLGLFKNARAAGIERAGHWLHHDRLDEFLRLVREFLAP
jgi:pimeloyl-ACP methyl ester carboxylesterase